MEAESGKDGEDGGGPGSRGWEMEEVAMEFAALGVVFAEVIEALGEGFGGGEGLFEGEVIGVDVVGGANGEVESGFEGGAGGVGRQFAFDERGFGKGWRGGEAKECPVGVGEHEGAVEATVVGVAGDVGGGEVG